jgi:hypothetical protein
MAAKSLCSWRNFTTIVKGIKVARVDSGRLFFSGDHQPQPEELIAKGFWSAGDG